MEQITDLDKWTWWAKTFEKDLVLKLLEASVDRGSVRIAVIGPIYLYKRFLRKYVPEGLIKSVRHITHDEQTRGTVWNVLITLPNFMSTSDWYEIIQSCRRRDAIKVHLEDI